LVAVGLLLAGSLWSVWDDNIKRRPWKFHQAVFSRTEQAKIQAEIDKQDEHLAADPAYQQALQDLAAAQERLKSGDTGARVKQLEAELSSAKLLHADADLRLRIIKSRLEEAWYEYEAAHLEHRPTAAAKAHIDALEVERAADQKEFDDTQAKVDRITSELAELRSEVKRLDDKVKLMASERERLVQKLDNVSLKMGPLRLPPIPKIRQVVLPDFERNNFDQLVARVERCESCHAGIDKPGFEDQPQPYTSHPRRELFLAKHPPEKFGCTPCHQGQGAAVNSTEQAHGFVKHWEKPMVLGDKVEAGCIKCHANVARLPGAETVAHGEKLFEELGCHGCHLVEGYDGIPKVGPYLRRIAAKVEPSWLVRWVQNPHEFRPNTRMPNFLFHRDEAIAVSAYLLSATQQDSNEWLESRPLPAGIDPNNPTLVAQGQELVDNIGCRGCHGFAEGESPAFLGENKDVAPNLSHIAEKTDGRWIYYWLKGPRQYSPEARMPSLRLSDAEAKAITSFLLTLGQKKPDPELIAKLQDPQQAETGKALVRKYGCFGCHNIPGMEKESRVGVELTTFGSKTLDELFFGNRTDIPQTWDDWTFVKIKTPRTYATERIEQAMPQFDLADNDIKALRVFLASRTDQRYPEKYHAVSGTRAQQIVEGRRLINRYNCVGCHVVDGKGGAIRARYEEQMSMAPPILNGEGAKVQSNWFYGFLKEPVSIRPWLKVRMPTFGLEDDEATGIVEYFMALDGIEKPYVHIADANIPAENIEGGKLLMSEEYFGCFSCHQQGDRKPEGPPDGWAPDLAMARQRLNPDWIITWLHDPQKLQPGTKMPSFYPGGPEDVLGGSDERQIRAMRDYILTLGRPRMQMAQAGGG
jgi:mono/diheme cytochrome c family protein